MLRLPNALNEDRMLSVVTHLGSTPHSLMEKEMSTSQVVGSQVVGHIPVTQRYGYGRLREYDREAVRQRISWRALIAGLVIVVAVQLLLGTLGAGIGLSMVHQPSNTPDASTFSMGAGLWWLVSTLIALAIGGYLTARLAGVPSRYDGLLHGLVLWGLTTLVAVYLLTTAIGGVLGGAFNIMGSTVSAAGSTLKTAAAPVLQDASAATPVNIQQYLRKADPDPKSMSPQDAQKEIASQLAIYEAGGSQAPAAKQKIISIMAAQMNISQGDATARFNDLQGKATNAKNQAVQTAQNVAMKTAQVTSAAAFVAFAALLLGAIVSAIGGSLAVPRKTLVAETVTRT
jgi:hypothetical protein